MLMYSSQETHRPAPFLPNQSIILIPFLTRYKTEIFLLRSDKGTEKVRRKAEANVQLQRRNNKENKEVGTDDRNIVSDG